MTNALSRSITPPKLSWGALHTSLFLFLVRNFCFSPDGGCWEWSLFSQEDIQAVFSPRGGGEVHTCALGGGRQGQGGAETGLGKSQFLEAGFGADVYMLIPSCVVGPQVLLQRTGQRPSTLTRVTSLKRRS